jgi:hypothetical protein
MTTRRWRLLCFGGQAAAAGLFVAAALLGACKGLPDVTFTGDDASDGRDATVHDDASDDATGTDGSNPGADDAGEDSGGPVDNEDAEAPEGGIACGDGSVSGCQLCQGAPLRCKKGSADECVADCASCSPTWLPCWHCPGSGTPRGVCLAVGGNGELACAAGNACGCDAAADCPSSGGGAEVCLVDASAKGGRCATCGQTSTNGEPCTDNGGAGTCTAGTSTPTCQ